MQFICCTSVEGLILKRSLMFGIDYSTDKTVYMNLHSVYGTANPVIGMVHLEPLPGSPKHSDPLQTVIGRAVRDAERLEAGGVDGIMLENFGDAPFYPDDVPKHTVAAMTRAATAVSEATTLPIGINVLRNDPIAALSIAHAVDAAYIRVNVHTGARVTDQGVIEGVAHETLRLQKQLGSDVSVFADVDVKHSAPLASESFTAESFADQTDRGLADAAILTGSGTGHAADQSYLESMAAVREDYGLTTPIFVGSGVTKDSIETILSTVDGAIVGTSLKQGGQTTAPVSVDRVRELMAAAERVR